MISENQRFSLRPDLSVFLQIREGLGLTRREFGDVIGVDQDTVSAWERGKASPWLAIWQIKMLDRMLEDLGLTWRDLPDNVGPPNVPEKQYKRTRQRKI